MPDTFGVIPQHTPCMCGGTGWVTYIGPDGYGHEIPCPNDCPPPGDDDD